MRPSRQTQSTGATIRSHGARHALLSHPFQLPRRTWMRRSLCIRSRGHIWSGRRERETVLEGSFHKWNLLRSWRRSSGTGQSTPCLRMETRPRWLTRGSSVKLRRTRLPFCFCKCCTPKDCLWSGAAGSRWDNAGAPAACVCVGTNAGHKHPSRCHSLMYTQQDREWVRYDIALDKQGLAHEVPPELTILFGFGVAHEH